MRAALAIGAVLILGAAASRVPAHRHSRTVAVHIANFAFVPADTAVAPGDTVLWINDDDFEHVVAADSASWKSPTLTHGSRYTFVAAHAGHVLYHCAAHPIMHGRLTITE